MPGDILLTTNIHIDGDWTSGAKPIINTNAIMKAGVSGTIIDTAATIAGVDLNLLMTEPGCISSFGTSASPIATAADLVQLFGSGGFHMNCHNNAAAVKTDRVDILAANSQVPVELGSANSGDYDWIECMRGLITLRGDIQFGASAKVVVRMIDSPQDVNLTIGSEADTLPTLDMHNGRCESDGPITEATIRSGATLIQDSAVLTTGYIAGSLRMDYGFGTAADATGTPIATIIYIYPGGMLDLTSPNTTLYKEITDVIVYPGGVFKRNTLLHVVTNGVTDYTGGSGIIAA